MWWRRQRMFGRRLLVAVIGVIVLNSLAGCALLPGNADQDAIRSASYTSESSLHALYHVLSDGSAAAAGQQALGSGATGVTRWAAILAYSGTGTDPSVVAPDLRNKDVSIRCAAAIGAIAMGDKDAFPVLIDLLGDDDLAAGTLPPQTYWQLADQALVRATAMSDFGPPLDGSMYQALDAQGKWKKWWKQEQSSLRFDATHELWSTK